ncbi:EAL domain-containing protein [Marinobacter confluentis]|uniref:EAL domain-containing protein n=1 Tax=Marinobacter confluentis TaxID=1697557 RepID=A0A4Z1BU85_9GAMM|nr:EAL domain-containing protein [Marinobacter confluentis]TGN41665.1 EAL domain-containing protein [Marinobacter confluentis]
MAERLSLPADRPLWLKKPVNFFVATALLCAFAVAGNALAVPLFYSVQFIFGSIAVFIAIAMLGAWPAIFVAAAGGLYTWLLWGHPYALMVFVAECLFVIWFCRRTDGSALLADGAYWFVLGIPATLLLYIFALGVELQTAFLMALKQMLNGIFNAAVAGIFLFFLRLIQNRISTAYLVSDQIRGIIFHTTLMIALVAGSIPILQFAHYKQHTQERQVEEQLAHQLERVDAFVRANPGYTNEAWARFRASLPDNTDVEIQPAGAAEAASKETGFQLEHKTSPDEPSLIKRWKQGNYQLTSRVEGQVPLDVVIKRSSRSISEEMDRASLEFLAYLGVLLVLGIAVARLMSNLLTRPIWRLSTLLNSATNGIITTDVSGRTEWVNLGFSRLSGYSLAELQGKRPGDLLQGVDTDPKTIARIGEHLRRQESFEEEILNYNRQGNPYWIRINCEPLRSENGQLAGFIAVETDITEQRKIAHLEKVGSEALQRIAQSERIDETLVALIQSVESLIPGVRCSVELESPLLSDHCDLHFACYLAVHEQSGGRYWQCAPASPAIVDSANQTIGRIHAFYQVGRAWSANDDEVFKRAASIVSVVIERYYAEYKLRESASVFRFANEGIILTDASGIVVDCNAAFANITGLQPFETRGRQIRELLAELEEVAEPGSRFQDSMTREKWVTDTWIRHKSGQRNCVRQSVSAVRSKQGTIHRYVYIFNDISELKEYESQLESMAKFDPLTGLPNRALLSDRLQQAIIQCDRTGSELAVFFIDLDGFKQINDRHGHTVGDQLLKTVANRLKSVMREGDTLARFGGDEFVVVAPLSFEVKSCQLLLDRILDVVSRSSRILGEEVSITASIGVTVYPQSETIDAEQLLRQADQAMYSAKQSGKNQCFYYDADSERAVRDLFGDLKRIEIALANDEFVLFFQPKVNMKTDELIGVEALIRWHHPERGLLAPDEFLPVVDQHSLGIALGEWVIRTALRQSEAWRKQGLNLSVSVNIDPYHLAQDNFVERLGAILQEFPELEPGDFEIEIVESSSLEDLRAVSRVINACRALGVRFGLDDFGTGYSSLTYLRQLPLDYLKIDMSFVRAMLDNPDDLSIVKGVLGLAKSFNLPVIAEGVETSAHYDLLISLGCDYGQGFWLSRPIPPDALFKWAKRWRKPEDYALDSDPAARAGSGRLP